jgi:hypothetical protein
MLSTTILRWLKRSSGSGRRFRPAGRRPFVPRLHVLEDRTVLTTFSVTTLADSGAGSLRQAILDANATPGDDTITFAVTGTINLASALPDLSSNIDVQGPGARALTVAGTHDFNALYISAGATVYLSGLTFSNSAMANSGTATVDSCSFNGGGMGGDGPLTIENSTVSGVIAPNYAGVGTSGLLTIRNSTISGNQATSLDPDVSCCAGVCTFGNLIIENSTVSGNSAALPPESGGFAGIPAGFVYATNTIAAGNYYGDFNGFLIGSNNFIGGNPLLGPLHNNGGPTDTMAPLPGSPALNAGDPAQLGVADQRGVVRSGEVNIGAYQASASALLVSNPDTVPAGVPFDVTVTAVDPFSQLAVGYTGTVTFNTTDLDPGVVLPADYAFTLDDGGLHTFTDTGLGETTLLTPGDQLLTVTDTADATLTGSATVTVDPGGPAPAPRGSPGSFGPGTIGAITPAQNVKASSAKAVERFFAALAEEVSWSLWLRGEHREAGDPAGWLLAPWPDAEGCFV